MLFQAKFRFGGNEAMDKKDMPRRREAKELRIRRTMAALEKNNMSSYMYLIQIS